MQPGLHRFVSRLTRKVAAWAPIARQRPAPRDAQLNVYNVKQMLAQEPQRFAFLRFDSNNDCNVRCVYCHNHRSKEVVATEDLCTFLERNVIMVENFQIGCIMEPTLDPRMCDLMMLVDNSRGRPTNTFLLQTNGILLHKHDQAKMRDAGLTHVCVSIDAADPAIHKTLRGGSSMAKVGANIESLRRHSPSIKLVFLTTVTNLNIHAMEDLVKFGLGLAVNKFVMREVFYFPDNNVVDHSKMTNILLEENDFALMKERLLATFGGRVSFDFADASFLDYSAKRIRADSFR